MAEALLTIEVQTRIGGAARPQSSLEPVHLRLVQEQLTLAELIRRTVEEQVRELLVRQKLDTMAARSVLDRHYLTEDDVLAQAEGDGAVRLPTRRPGQLDAEVEVRRALAAFERRAYAVFVDGQQVEDVQQVISVRPGTRVTFLRLMPLAGGA